MNDTISRRAAIEALGEEPLVWHEDDAGEVAERNQWRRDVAAIKALPSADAVPVVHGRWIPYNSKYGHDEKVYLCDQCNNNVGFTKMNFCPNCGARMDGEA